MEVRMKAREYAVSFTATLFQGLCENPDSKECNDSLRRLERDIEVMPFIDQFGHMEFSFSREPEEHAVSVLGQSNEKVKVPIEVSEAVAKMMTAMLVDSWGKALLNL